MNQKCIYENCNKSPNFNFKGETKGLYCKEHSLHDMFDVKHNKCNKEDCNTRSSYGYCGKELTLCSKHKEPLMFKNPKRTCIGNDEEDCKEMATYGITEPTHCEEHSSKDEICLIGSKCKECRRI